MNAPKKIVAGPPGWEWVKRAHEDEEKYPHAHHEGEHDHHHDHPAPLGEDAFRVGVAVMAAGRSVRMGRPKMLLPWGPTTMLGQHLRTWRTLGAAQVAAVHAAGDEPVRAEILAHGAEPIPNHDVDRDMIGSVLDAARWTGWRPELTHFAVVLGDQPHLRASTLLRLLDFAQIHPGSICQPGYRGLPQHPVLLPRELWRKLAAADPSPVTLRDFLQVHADLVALDPMPPGDSRVDIDTPEDYERLAPKPSGT